MRQSWNVRSQESQDNCFELNAGVHWSVSAAASQSHQCTSSRSDDIMMEQTTFSDWQVKGSWIVYRCLGLCKMVWDVVCWHAKQRGWRQANVPASESLVWAERIRQSLRFLSRRYDMGGSWGKIVRVAKSDNNISELSNRIRFVPVEILHRISVALAAKSSLSEQIGRSRSNWL